MIRCCICSIKMKEGGYNPVDTKEYYCPTCWIKTKYFKANTKVINPAKLKGSE